MTGGGAIDGKRIGAHLALAALGLIWMLLAPVPATAEAKTSAFGIGYLEITDDPRYQEHPSYTGLQLETRKRPFDGAALAIRESRVLGRVLKTKFELHRTAGANADELVAQIRKQQSEHGVRLFLIDAAAAAIGKVADAVAKDGVVLFNVSAPDDPLRRAGCKADVMHVIPSYAMLTDGLTQYLVSKRWRRALVLKGPSPEDAALVAAFTRSARKFGAKIVATKDFVLGHDPRQRDQNNIALMTASPSYDVVFLADSYGEFGRYVPYQTSLPRPVVGTEGLIASAWHWTWERYGAPQLNQRFDRRAKRRMQGSDWAAWAAVKAIVEAAARTRSSDAEVVTKYLRSGKLTLDAYKGTPASFRRWNNQLRQPILLHTHNAVVALAPVKGFLHPTDVLDTLGVDKPESGCKF
jgi:ABC transporter substrate binding protein (PQQ-dependent alcohol dehydrogenase system)